jgi:hypothetical protein
MGGILYGDGLLHEYTKVTLSLSPLSVEREERTSEKTGEEGEAALGRAVEFDSGFREIDFAVQPFGEILLFHEVAPGLHELGDEV